MSQPTSFIANIWTTDRRGVCTSAADHGGHALPALAVGSELADWLRGADPVDGPGGVLAVADALARLAPFHHEVQVRGADGTTRRIGVSGLPRFGAGGVCEGYSGAFVDVTAHGTLLERALRSEAQHRLIVDNSMDLIAHCGMDGRYIHVSPSYTAVVGWEPHEMVGQPVVDFLHPDDQEPAAQSLAALFSGEAMREVVEVRKRHRDGSFVELETKVRRVTDPATGALLGAVLVSRDITDRQRARRALEAAHAHVRTILESIEDGFFSVNRNWEVTYANSRAATLVGVPRGSSIGRPLWSVAGDLYDSEVGHIYRRAMETGENASFEVFYEPTGMWYSERVYAHDDGLSVFFHDITDRVQRDHLVRESERRLREMIAMTPTGYLLLDAGGVVREANPALCQLSGHTREELIGADVGTILRDVHAAALNVREPGAQGHALETVIRHRAGHVVYVLVNQSIARDAEGKVVSLTAFITDITERKHAEARLEQLATRDVLTGLPNRVWINGHLRAMLGDGAAATTVLFIDLNRFKEVNDSLGHAAGDALLQQVGTRLQSCMRPGDVVARLGGDEFVVAAHCAGRDAAAAIAQRLLKALTAPFEVDGMEMYVGASIGISLSGSDARTPELLFQNADTAMYRAKARGESAYQFFEPEMSADALRRLQVEAALRRALELGQFELHYQPRVDVRTLRLRGVEALLRWQHPELGRVGPFEFIPIAEERGHIEAIGLWVLEQACRVGRRVSEQYGFPLHVSVNVSARQLRSADLVADVARVLQETGFPARALELELTESALIEDIEQSVDVMRRLKTLGVKLALDDFGTGYSSLSYLKRFPVDVMKLDRSFFLEQSQDANGDQFVAALVHMAHALGLNVVAEGIETEDVLDTLRDCRCDEAQGYLFARPMALPEFEKFLQCELPAGRAA
jgi:diguanylate cyclase (GGDEF)-like protein/PAS domain S-box-containing protein